MKLRVVEKNNGFFYSEYYLEGSRCDYWAATYRDAELTYKVQNKFDTQDEAIAECLRFAEEHKKGTVVWEGEMKYV